MNNEDQEELKENINDESKYNKRIFIKSIICIVASLIAVIVGIFTNALRHKFLIDSKIIYVLIIIFLLMAIVALVLSEKTVFKKRIYDITDLLLYIGDIFAIFFIITTTFISPIRISGDSMNPTFKDGDLIFVSKINKLEHGDIAVFYLGDNNFENLSEGNAERLNDELLVKRIVGIPGDSIKVLGNVLYVNDEVTDTSCYRAEFLNDLEDGKIPEGYILALGDNRKSSSDSRDFGLVEIDNVMGYKIN